jgi:hypothetical protein
VGRCWRLRIGYVTNDGLEHRVSLSQAWATPFESCSPIRRFTSHKGQRHLGGLWWSATTGGHVGFESWMERDHVMALVSTRLWSASPRNRFCCPGATMRAN